MEDSGFEYSTEDGAKLLFLLRKIGLQTPKTERRDTVFIHTTRSALSVGEGGCDPFVRVESEINSVTFVSDPEDRCALLHQVLAFRFPESRHAELPEKLQHMGVGSFPLQGQMRVILNGQWTLESAAAVGLLCLTNRLFDGPQFSFPVTNSLTIAGLMQVMERDWQDVVTEKMWGTVVRSFPRLFREIASFSPKERVSIAP